MNKKICNKKIWYINLAVIVLLIAMSIILFSIPSVHAEGNDTELEIIDYSSESSQVITINNINNFVEQQTHSRLFRKSNNSLTIAKEIYSKLGFDEEEIAEMDNEKLNSILNVKSATVKQMFIATDESGEIYSVPAQNMSRAANQVNHLFPDIANDKGTTGYMAGRIEIYQDSNYDKYDSVKDPNTNTTKITKFYAYGYRAECSMWWIKEPAYVMQDAFVVNWSGDAYTEASYTENSFTHSFVSSVEGQTSENVPIIWQANNKPSGKFYINGGSHISYRNNKITAKLKIRANNGFDINMGYAHKQIFATGEFGYELGKDASIKFKLTVGAREYISGPLHVECIKNPEMEALR